MQAHKWARWHAARAAGACTGQRAVWPHLDGVACHDVHRDALQHLQHDTLRDGAVQLRVRRNHCKVELRDGAAVWQSGAVPCRWGVQQRRHAVGEQLLSAWLARSLHPITARRRCRAAAACRCPCFSARTQQAEAAALLRHAAEAAVQQGKGWAVALVCCVAVLQRLAHQKGAQCRQQHALQQAARQPGSFSDWLAGARQAAQLLQHTLWARSDTLMKLLSPAHSCRTPAGLMWLRIA